MPTDRDYWRADKVVYRRKPAKGRALLNKSRLIAIGVLIFLGLLYLGVYIFLHLEAFRITSVSVSSQNPLLAQDIKDFLEFDMGGDIFYLLPKNNFLFFSPPRAEAKLLNNFPAIKSITLEKIFPHELSAIVLERSLWAIYCKGLSEGTGSSSPDRLTRGTCFFMDREGRLFQEAPQVEGSLILRFTSDEEKLAQPGSQVFREEELSEFQKWAETFRDNVGVGLSGFELRKNSPDDIWLITNDGYSVIVKKNDDDKKVAGIVRTVLENEIKNRTSSLRYIDARFGNKVFYKF